MTERLCHILGGIALTDPLAKSMNALPLFVPPLLVIVGIIIAISPLIINPEGLSQVKIIWKVASLVITIIFLFFFIYIIIFEFPLSVILLLEFVNVLSFIVILKIMKMIQLESSGRNSGEKIGDELNIMEVLTRPMKVTEEEVTISKEKKICIVCKGKVLRNNVYLCPSCGTFYYQKCSSSLSDLENACWVCNTPFDESKPTTIVRTTQENSFSKPQKNNLKFSES
ncbi:MAG: membrane protein of unknown function [Promethearchaeota archaeon]|nr:MAG: membrane protein of unknown function [Candidatus Lokiarchaeota archaeon]